LSLVVVNGGKVTLLQFLVTPLQGYVLALYVNNRTPVITDTLANYTEASFPGYARINLTGWNTAFLNGASKAETDELVRVFTQSSVPTPQQTVYGYLVIDNVGNLAWAELNPSGGVLMNGAGQTYTVLPRLTLDTGP
jgi:hypothetical protein